MEIEKNNVLTNAFTWLFIGLILCFGISYACSLNENIIYLVYGSFGGYGYLIFCILELVIAIILSVRILKMQPITAKILYMIYCLLTGLSLNGIFIVYTTSSICYIFLATALLFGIFAIIGKTTKVDLSKWYIYLFVGLLAIIILEIINMFILNNTLDMVLSIAVILIFCAYTAYDIQMATKRTFLANCENKGIYVAFNLFLDFINLFIKLLRLFGKSND